MKNKNFLEKDLDFILAKTISLWDELRNQRIFITGGTGFFGSWLLESFSWANKKLVLNATAVVLTRNPLLFKKKCPHLFNDSAIYFHQGSLTEFSYPSQSFAFIIHAALDTETNSTLDTTNLLSFEKILSGTKYVLNFARHCGAKKIIFISSGAVYGHQSNSCGLDETDFSQFDVMNLNSCYALGKFLGEYLCKVYAEQYQLNIKIARCFAFIGPYIPLNKNFAIGNFLLNRLRNEPITVNSDGVACRSYLYMADLMIWLWTILFRGKNLFPYNVGSDQKITIFELASLIANIEPKLKVKVKKKICKTAALAHYYVPDITRAKTDLNLKLNTNLLEAINLTIRWFALQQYNWG